MLRRTCFVVVTAATAAAATVPCDDTAGLLQVGSDLSGPTDQEILQNEIEQQVNEAKVGSDQASGAYQTWATLLAAGEPDFMTDMMLSYKEDAVKSFEAAQEALSLCSEKKVGWKNFCEEKLENAKQAAVQAKQLGRKAMMELTMTQKVGQVRGDLAKVEGYTHEARDAKEKAKMAANASAVAANASAVAAHVSAVSANTSKLERAKSEELVGRAKYNAHRAEVAKNKAAVASRKASVSAHTAKKSASKSRVYIKNIRSEAKKMKVEVKKMTELAEEVGHAGGQAEEGGKRKDGDDN